MKKSLDNGHLVFRCGELNQLIEDGMYEAGDQRSTGQRSGEGEVKQPRRGGNPFHLADDIVRDLVEAAFRLSIEEKAARRTGSIPDSKVDVLENPEVSRIIRVQVWDLGSVSVLIESRQRREE